MDTYIIKDPQFAWMVDVQNRCKTINSKFNWGKNFEHLIEVCEELDMRMASLTTFSKPRFANSIKNVTINVWQDYKAINKCLNDIEKTLGNKRGGQENASRNCEYFESCQKQAVYLIS